ncbi:hypothetical protein [Desulfovibrio fairfieldensis]|uniref:4-amino-4-deoxy-L-arabinose transferase n=1 Tax=Desulfovibrio fairfieldensis TaxID=44742 RepID=A0A109W3M6_9BACT|nr:hypothetical protein [Desulfovibrio fairfieldensis]AMD88953.1 hypothetical protein AXF13_01810 [Desulfovibrio fairfieldensis]
MTSDKAPTPSPDASPESRTDAMPDAAPETTRAGKPDDTSAAAGTPEQAEQTGPGGQDAVAGQPEAAATPNDAHADKSNGGHVPSRAEKQAAPVPPAGRAEKFFQTLCCLGPLVLLAVLAAQAWPDFWQGWRGDALYCPAEVRNIQIFLHAQQDGQWLAPGAGLATESAAGLAAQWPGFTWFLASLAALLPPALLFPLSGALAAALALLGVWGLSRAAGFDSKAALAAGLILLCMPIFAPLAHFTGPAALAAALLLFSLICFCRGWQAQRAWFYLPAGFVLAGLAGLTGGLFHLLLPLLASALFLLWRATFRRAQALDALTGFVLLLLLLALWLGGIILWTNAEGYMQGLFATVRQWHGPVTARWWLPLSVAGLGLVPWIGMVVCVSWQRVLRSAWSDLKASRAERAGSAFVWIGMVLACLLSLFMPMAQLQSVAVCLACLAAPLLGKALLRLPHLGSRLFYLIAALCLLHAGMALVAASFGFSLDWMARFFSWPLSPEQREMILGLRALPVLGTLCLLAAVAMTRFIRRDHPGGALLFCTLVAVILTQPAALMLAPELAALPEAHLSRLQDIRMPTMPENAVTPAAPATPQEEGTPPVPAAPEATLPDQAPNQASDQARENTTPAPEPTAQPEAARPETQPETPQAVEPLPETAREAGPEQTTAPAPAATPEAVPQPLPQSEEQENAPAAPSSAN